jgi:Transglycosylase SLT domain
MRFAVLLLMSLAFPAQSGSSDYFVPSHRISGIGVARDDLSDDLVAARADLMIQSQTFTIMREQQALPGARRITTDRRLQSIFRSAADKSGLPVSLIEAIAYLESWGDPKAESPSGPRGIMQISAATARSMGLRVVVATRYRVTRERVPVPGKKKKFRTITHRTPYVVTTRDDRLSPERAIPAAAHYLAGMEQKFGGRDWAIFAYHCGQGCVAEMLDLTRRARGIPANEVTVPRMFFSSSPVWNHELYQAIQQEMQRDYSPTYYFRIMRAAQLLDLYRHDPDAFGRLAEEYRGDFPPGTRPQHRLAIWLKQNDFVFRKLNDIRDDEGKRLAKAIDRPDYLGYSLRLSSDTPADAGTLAQASPAALGALAYIAFETRRLFEQMNPPGQTFQPLPVSSLVEPEDFARQLNPREGLAHTSGLVFDIDYSGLNPAEVECLRFVLDDLGWDGYLGFIEEGSGSLHIGPSPASRDFFTSVFQESLGDTEKPAEKTSEESTPQPATPVPVETGPPSPEPPASPPPAPPAPAPPVAR